VAFPDFAYMRWAKTARPARINLARSGVAKCPPTLLAVRARDVAIDFPPGYGYLPLRKAIARRYRVGPDQVFPVSGGTSMANWIACVAALDGGGRDKEVIVERPTYEALVRIPEALGCRVRRLDRRFGEGYTIDLDRFRKLVNRRTRLAIVSVLHNPSGASIEPGTLTAMAEMLAETGAALLVDEVYLECLFERRTWSTVHAGPNVLATNSLTKAYGLDGLRAGWILGPAELVRKAGHVYDLLGVNSVAAGESLTLRALERLPLIKRRARGLLDEGLKRVKAFLAGEPRLEAVIPSGGCVVFPRLPRGMDDEAFSRHLLERYATLVPPGRFFEAPGHIRLSFGIPPVQLGKGLRRLSRSLDDLGA
jgi:aspartate/methionine/tyrosine aminotransferase